MPYFSPFANRTTIINNGCGMCIIFLFFHGL